MKRENGSDEIMKVKNEMSNVIIWRIMKIMKEENSMVICQAMKRRKWRNKWKANEKQRKSENEGNDEIIIKRNDEIMAENIMKEKLIIMSIQPT